MSSPSLIERLKGARVVQVLIVYLGASWAVLQITDTVIGLMNLPDWVGPSAVLLMLIGLVVVVATAFVQGSAETTAAEEAGEVPTDWEVDPGDVVASLRAGKLPHLTWGRAVLGGVVALSLLFGASGVYVLLTGGSGLIGPAEVGADEAAAGIAVLPFSVSGGELAVYGEGMVDLVSANLDGMSDYRAVDARTVLARWNREIDEGAGAELGDMLRVAAGTGARYAVVGTGTDVGTQVRFTANLYDLADQSRVGTEARVDGSPDEVLRLVDELTVSLVRSLLDAVGGTSTSQTLRVEGLLTTSVPALRSYLAGEAAFRRTNWTEAREAFEDAVEEDPDFAMAWWRLGQTKGWDTSVDNNEGTANIARAAELEDRLPAREAALVRVSRGITGLDALPVLGVLRDYLSRYPDDPDGWFQLGEAGLHAAEPAGVTDAEVEQALYRAVELDPAFLPFYQHAIEWASAKGHEDRFLSLMNDFRSLDAPTAQLDRFQMRWDLLHGDEAARSAAVAIAETMNSDQSLAVDQGMVGFADANLERLEPLKRRNRFQLGGAGPPGSPMGLQELYIAQGRWTDLWDELKSDPSGAAVAQFVNYVVAASGPSVETARPWVEELFSQIPTEPDGGDPSILFARAFASIWLDDGTSLETLKARLAPALNVTLGAIPPGAIDTTGVRGAVNLWVDALDASKRGDHDAAFAALDQARSQTRGVFANSGLYTDLGEQAVLSGRWTDAIRIFEGISRSATERTWAKFRLGGAYEATGQNDRALDAYRTFLLRTEMADPGWSAVEEARRAVERLGG